jgi:hypothetical protein
MHSGLLGGQNKFSFPSGNFSVSLFISQKRTKAVNNNKQASGSNALTLHVSKPPIIMSPLKRVTRKHANTTPAKSLPTSSAMSLRVVFKEAFVSQ